LSLTTGLCNEEADLLVGAVGQLHGRADVALLGDGLRRGLAHRHLDLVAVGVAGRLGQLRGARQLELVLHRVPDQDGAALRVAVPDRVGLRLAQLGGGVEHALDRLLACQLPAVLASGLLRLEDAVRKMTSLNAAKFGLRDRCQLRPGAWADIAVFDPERVTDHATYSEPFRYGTGVEYVVVNGQLVLDRGKHTGARPGRALRHGRP
jgi:hypothetical protein